MTITIRLKSKKKGVPGLEFNYPLGKDLGEVQTILDDDTIYAAAIATFRQQLADHVRRLLGKKKGAPTPEALQESLNAGEWKPGQRRRGKSTADKAKTLLAGMSPADRQRLIDDLAKQPPTAATKPHEPDDVELAS